MTRDAPRSIRRSVLTQRWSDVAFVHWSVDPAAVAHLLPPGTVPDVVDGRTFVGLVAFRLHSLGWPRLGNVWSFPETNVRLYATDDAGRAGVVFLSMDAANLTFSLAARASARLPYMWSDMTMSRSADVLSYTCRRRWPRPGATSRLTVRVGERVAQPTALEQFLTARWGLYTTLAGRTVYLPNDHAAWDLNRATLVECEGDLVTAAGVPISGEPVSVLHSPGVLARFGLPSRRPSRSGTS
ncbi:YqjF family protein [Lentzea sp. NPDC058436]|uniref:YqjF family protein n=1 Tax=Lentzea sp. NPDC058436 TaxID=3346499 RepID=UPI003666758A